MQKISELQPVIAIIGRPNVGKSTLFNRLTRTQQALVADMPGVTRDRLYGQAQLDDRTVIVVDTGGLTTNKDGIEELMAQQTWAAIAESNVVLFIVDARSGLTASDQMVAQKLRESGKPIILVANKTDGLDADVVVADFYQLGLGEVHPVAAAHGHYIEELTKAIVARLPEIPAAVEQRLEGIKIAIIGKPNVGKSTLVNRMLGEDRVLVFDAPGTTRDSIFIPLERDGKKYVLIDTAGVRRRKAVTEALEKFSVIKSLQAVEAANVVIMVIDARENIAEQDLRLLGFILEAGKSLIIVINKWDGLQPDQREQVKSEIDRRLSFVEFAPLHFISALHGTGVGDLFKFVEQAYHAATRELATSELTRVLETAVEAYQPPSAHGREIKMRYAHAGGHNPPVIVIHGRRVKYLPLSYQRYLAGYFRKTLKLIGTPVRIILKEE